MILETARRKLNAFIPRVPLEDREDIAQEVCIAVLRHVEAGHVDPERVVAYTRSAARHKAINFMKRAWERRARPLEWADPEDDRPPAELRSPDPGPEHELAIKRAAEHLAEILGEAPERYRQVFYGIHVDGHSAEELAQQYGVPRNTIDVWNRRAKLWLLRHVTEHNVNCALLLFALGKPEV
jgi:RNA polymerase sigma factor (sigma-70 family)